MERLPVRHLQLSTAYGGDGGRFISAKSSPDIDLSPQGLQRRLQVFCGLAPSPSRASRSIDLDAVLGPGALEPGRRYCEGAGLPLTLCLSVVSGCAGVFLPRKRAAPPDGAALRPLWRADRPAPRRRKARR